MLPRHRSLAFAASLSALSLSLASVAVSPGLFHEGFPGLSGSIEAAISNSPQSWSNMSGKSVAVRQRS